VIRKRSGYFTYMKSHVNLEAASAGVPFVALPECACKWFLAGMGEFVSLEMAFGYKLIFAYAAGERTLSSVGPHMSLEVASLRELFEAALIGTE
jgi:hypothetical protein